MISYKNSREELWLFMPLTKLISVNGKQADNQHASFAHFE